MSISNMIQQKKKVKTFMEMQIVVELFFYFLKKNYLLLFIKILLVNFMYLEKESIELNAIINAFNVLSLIFD